MRIALSLTIFLSALGCERAQPIPPPTDKEPKKPAVVAALKGFGECRVNRCIMHFALQASGDARTVTATRCGEIGPECGVRQGALTDAGITQVQALTGRLLSEKLEAHYGCPGCADGPIAELVLHHPDGTETHHKFDPTRTSSLPQALRDASSLMEDVAHALARCANSALFTSDGTCQAALAKDMKHPLGIP